MKSVLLSLVPALITGGPVIIAISAGRGSDPSSHWLWLTVAGYAGAVALAIGLVVMFREILRLRQEVRQMRQLVKDSTS